MAAKSVLPRVVVDVGNSETVVGYFRGEDLEGHWRLVSLQRTADEIALLLDTLFMRSGMRARGVEAVLSSVVPPVTGRFARALHEVTGAEPLVVGERSVPGLSIRYLDPSAVGPDRLANAVGVAARHGKPAVVVDLGTATTFDVVGSRGEYLGGAIAPGVWTSSEDLFRRAARLARVELEWPERAVGRTTAESLQAGILMGTAGMVDSLVRRIAAELKRPPRVVATGGLAAKIAPHCETVEAVDEWLTLHGLRLIAERVRAKSRRRPAPARKAKKKRRR